MQQQFLQGLKELGVYLGGKLDTLAAATRAPMKIDLGKASEELAGAAKALSEVSDTLGQSERSMNMAAVVAQLQGVLTSIERQAQAVGNLAGKMTSDEAKRTNALLASLITAVQGIRIEERELDMSALSDVRTILLAIQREIESMTTKTLEGKIDTLVDAIRSWKVEMPKTWKIDDEQLKRLVMASGGGGGGVTTAMVPRRVAVANVSMATGGTEYSYTFPKGTVAFYMKLRGVDQQFQYAWVSTESGTTYMTTTYNFLQSRENVDFGGKTIYFQCAADTQVMEIESFTA